MIEIFLTALPSLKIELEIDIASALGRCELYCICCGDGRNVTGGFLFPLATSFLLPVSAPSNLLEADNTSSLIGDHVWFGV